MTTDDTAPVTRLERRVTDLEESSAGKAETLEALAALRKSIPTEANVDARIRAALLIVMEHCPTRVQIDGCCIEAAVDALASEAEGGLVDPPEPPAPVAAPASDGLAEAMEALRDNLPAYWETVRLIKPELQTRRSVRLLRNACEGIDALIAAYDARQATPTWRNPPKRLAGFLGNDTSEHVVRKMRDGADHPADCPQCRIQAEPTTPTPAPDDPPREAMFVQVVCPVCQKPQHQRVGSRLQGGVWRQWVESYCDDHGTLSYFPKTEWEWKANEPTRNSNQYQGDDGLCYCLCHTTPPPAAATETTNGPEAVSSGEKDDSEPRTDGEQRRAKDDRAASERLCVPQADEHVRAGADQEREAAVLRAGVVRGGSGAAGTRSGDGSVAPGGGDAGGQRRHREAMADVGATLTGSDGAGRENPTPDPAPHPAVEAGEIAGGTPLRERLAFFKRRSPTFKANNVDEPIAVAEDALQDRDHWKSRADIAEAARDAAVKERDGLQLAVNTAYAAMRKPWLQMLQQRDAAERRCGEAVTLLRRFNIITGLNNIGADTSLLRDYAAFLRATPDPSAKETKP